jgi:hypothetical protein
LGAKLAPTFDFHSELVLAATRSLKNTRSTMAHCYNGDRHDAAKNATAEFQQGSTKKMNADKTGPAEAS